MKAAIFLIKFLLIGALFIVSNENLALKDPGNFERFSSLYASWLGSVFDNGKQITGYVVQAHWVPDTTGAVETQEIVQTESLVFKR